MNITWATAHDGSDLLEPKPDAVIESLTESAKGISLRVKERNKSFVGTISEKQDVQILRDRQKEIIGKTLEAVGIASRASGN